MSNACSRSSTTKQLAMGFYFWSQFTIRGVLCLLLWYTPANTKGKCLLDIEVLGPSLVMLHTYKFNLYKFNSSLINFCNISNENDLDVGSLASVTLKRGQEPLVGVLSGVVGTHQVLLVNLLNSPPIHVTSEKSLEWLFEGGQCWFELQESGFIQSSITLDKGDQVHLQVRSLLRNSSNISGSTRLNIPSYLGEIAIIFENASLFEFLESVAFSGNDQIQSLIIWQKGSSFPHQSLVSFQLVLCPQLCPICNLTFTLNIDCPVTKKLAISYPRVLEESEFLSLPVNYRPPSALGEGISLTPHIYNADPSVPLSRLHATLSKDIIYKQCWINQSRSNCNCSQVQAAGSDIAFSDCIQKVYRHPFVAGFPLNFYLLTGNNETRSNVSLYSIFLEELNNRTDFILGSADNNEISEAIVFSGSGLYHFRATLSSSNTFCNLDTQFIVFIEGRPLLKVEEQSIAILTIVTCGLGLFTVYLLHYYFRAAPHKHNHNNNKVRPS